MDMAIAEKGLVVFDASVKGTPSHAAHPNEDNAIYKTAEVLTWFRDFRFEKLSESLGEVKLTVTQINAGSQHNVVPAQVDLVIDVRVNDCYTNSEIQDILLKKAPVEVLKARSLRLSSSGISKDHPLVKAVTVRSDFPRLIWAATTLYFIVLKPSSFVVNSRSIGKEDP